MDRLPFELQSPLFHTSHIVGSVDEALDVYTRLFARPILHAGYWELGHRWAIFVYVGDIWVEAAMPDSHASGLRTFLDRFGSRLHSLGWYVDGVDHLGAALRGERMRIAEDPDPAVAYRSFNADDAPTRPVPRHGPIPLPAGYRHGYPDGWESAVIYTHFRDTHGMFEFCEATDFHAIPPREPDVDMLADSDPLGIERSSHHTIVVEDLEAATSLWLRLGATLVARRPNDMIGAQSSIVRVGGGTGTVLELAQPDRPGPARSDLDSCGMPILHSITFRVSDLGRVTDHLAAVGIKAEVADDTTVVTDPTTTAGARYGFTVAPVGT